MTTRAQLRRRLAAVTAVWAALLSANNLLPFVGLRDDSCQTMFSDMAYGERWNTHWLVPQYALSDLWASLEIRDVVIEPVPTAPHLLAVERWLTRPDRLRNTEAVRVAVWQLCRAGCEVAFDARRADGDHDFEHHPDACAVPALSEPHLWIPVRLYDTDLPAEAE